ncbi:MAG: glutamine synthetase family protein [Candidatus Omnitrophota bacterium]|nr:glutamine synthetase family protein [bacterium]MBU3929093.1 glutamine synthetase family protein [bacterium]
MKKKMTADDVLKIVKEKNVRFIKIWFVDVLGTVKSFTITANELPKAFADGMGFDGSSIEGFARIYESDLIAKPDPSTFEILPWRPKEDAVARMFCDLYTPDDKPYAGDTRYILKRNLDEMRAMGYDLFNVGPELEYFYFKSDSKPEITDKGGYFDYLPLDTAHDLRRETIMALEDMGVVVEYSHHEVAPSQHEIDLRYAEALGMADNVITYKVAVKSVAWNNGLYASFMPKPIFGENGSGMHVHQSLFLKGKNTFFDKSDEFNLSADARHYIAGIMKYAREICLVTNQWTNSYKRLVPGYEAPVYIVWGRRNRSALVRVPMYKPGQENATRVEVRFPDPACNPYLAFSVMLAAGLDGIKNKLEMPDPVELDVFHLTDAERTKMGIKTLPGSLIEAIEVTEKSELVRKTLGDHVFDKLIENKKIEWDKYRQQVTQFELDNYLPIL